MSDSETMMVGLVVAGTNSHGECFLPVDEDTIAVPTSAPLEWLVDGRVVRVAVGTEFTLLLDDTARVHAVGKNDSGQLGRGHNNNDDPDNRITRPVTGLGQVRVTLIAAGFKHCAAVTEGGQLLMWGGNASGQCGFAGDDVLVPARCTAGAFVDADLRVAFVACGLDHTVAVTTGGGVIVFGCNDAGQLGTGNDHDQPTPVLLTGAELEGVRIAGCAAGSSFTLLMSDTGRVFALGHNEHGQLGLGIDFYPAETGMRHLVFKPTEIDAQHFGGVPAVAVACGDTHTLVLTADRKLYACGNGRHGATGFGHMNDAMTPQPVAGALEDVPVVMIATGYTHSCALTSDGRIFAFGTDGGITDAGGAYDYGWQYDFGDGWIAHGGREGFEWWCTHCGNGPTLNDADNIACSQPLPDDHEWANGGMDAGPCERPRPFRQLLPCLLQGELADTTVCALRSGCMAQHSAFVSGEPPQTAGWLDVPMTFAMQKPAAKKPHPKAVLAAKAAAAAAATDGEPFAPLIAGGGDAIMAIVSGAVGAAMSGESDKGEWGGSSSSSSSSAFAALSAAAGALASTSKADFERMCEDGVAGSGAAPAGALTLADTVGMKRKHNEVEGEHEDDEDEQNSGASGADSDGGGGAAEALC